MNRRVVVTGLGTFGAFGCGREALAEALRTSRRTECEIDTSQGFHREGAVTRIAAAPVVDFGSRLSRNAARRMSPPSRMGVLAAMLALEDAGLASAGPRNEVESVSVSSAFGPSSYTQRLLDQIFDEGPDAASPFLFAECVANAPAAQISLQCGARGPNHTVYEREAGPLLAVALAARDVQSGRAGRALTGAVEEITPLVHGLLDRFRAVGSGRPFDCRRDGVLPAEGASVLVLEDEEQARRRGARIDAAVVGWGAGFDPGASRVGWGRGVSPLAAALAATLERARTAPGEIDLVVSGASGSVAGDRLETAVLRAVWGSAPLPPLIAPKGVVGEYAGGFLGAAVLAAAGAPFGASATPFEIDPALDVVADCAATPFAGRRLLVSSLAAGGGAAWLVLETA